MPVRSNNTEGIPNAATVTQGSGGNSGGVSGDFWDTVTIGASATLTSDNAWSAHGTQSHAFTTGASAVQCKVSWTVTATGTYWIRMYYQAPSSFATTPTLSRFQGAGAQVVRFGTNASGNVTIRDGSGSNVLVGTSTTALATSTAYRIEATCTQGASSTAEVKIWATLDGPLSSPTETLTVTAKNFGTNNIDLIEFGQTAALANMPTWRGDDFGASDIGYLGPTQLWTPGPLLVALRVPWAPPPQPLILRNTLVDVAPPMPATVVPAITPRVFPSQLQVLRNTLADPQRPAPPLILTPAAGPVPTPRAVIGGAPAQPGPPPVVGIPGYLTSTTAAGSATSATAAATAGSSTAAATGTPSTAGG